MKKRLVGQGLQPSTEERGQPTAQEQMAVADLCPTPRFPRKTFETAAHDR